MDIRTEYSKLKEFIRDEKIKEDEEWRSNLPFKLGFLVMLGIVVILFFEGIFTSMKLMPRRCMRIGLKIAC